MHQSINQLINQFIKVVTKLRQKISFNRFMQNCHEKPQISSKFMCITCAVFLIWNYSVQLLLLKCIILKYRGFPYLLNFPITWNTCKLFLSSPKKAHFRSSTCRWFEKFGSVLCNLRPNLNNNHQLLGNLCLRKTRSGKSRDYRDVIVFKNLFLSKWFLSTQNAKPLFSNSSGWTAFFKGSVFVTD